MYNDTRLGGLNKYYASRPKDWNMRIPDELLKGVVFICVKIAGGKYAGQYQSFGTGFFVGVSETNWLDFSYLVTARHIIDEAKRVGYETLYARINTRDGGVDYIELNDPHSWIIYKDVDIDLALIPLSPDLDKFDVGMAPEGMLINNDELGLRNIGEGDELLVTGLFTQHTGKERNIPIVRSGIIAAMPWEKITGKAGEYTVYLAELRSIGGISGSPVYIYLDNRRVYDSKVEEGKYQLLLLGLIRGHWDIKQEFSNDSETLIEDVQLGYNKGENLNTGIAMITPSQYILAALHSSPLKEMRQKTRERLEKENAGLQTLDAGDLTPASNGEFTQIDFQDALKKASSRISERESEKKETSD